MDAHEEAEGSTATAVAAPAPEGGHALPDGAVDMRSAALGVIAVLASVFALRWAAPVFIPLMMSLLLTYALSPAVERLARWHVSRWIGAALVLLALLGAIGFTGYRLAGNAGALLDALPVAAQKLRLHMQASRRAGDVSALTTVQKAAAHLEQVAEGEAEPPRRGVTRVTIERPRFNVRDYLWSGTMGLVSMALQLTLVTFLAYFALASGTMFRRKLVRISGAKFSRKKITVQVLDDIVGHVERYLLVQILTSVVVGVATGLAFWAFGLENAAVWGIVAGVTNLIPYIGSLLVMVGAGLLALLQFDSYEMALLIAGSSLAIHTLVGQLLVPWLTSRTSRMNPVAVFVGVIFWGWLWGVPGLLLGIPIMMVIKAICDHVEDLQPVGELLSD
nr:AI-2E family transporter [Pseudorhodoferax sp. Leaf274]